MQIRVQNMPQRAVNDQYLTNITSISIQIITMELDTVVVRSQRVVVRKLYLNSIALRTKSLDFTINKYVLFLNEGLFAKNI